MRCISVGLCEPHRRALAGLLPFVARKMRPDASAILDRNFNSWPASFEVEGLLREEVNLNTLFAKANKVLWTRKKNSCSSSRGRKPAVSAGCRTASLFQWGCPILGYVCRQIPVYILILYFRGFWVFSVYFIRVTAQK